ncbi:MAG: hypothetical protein A2Z24_02585 [Candidatus Woykebacteria bacterium RBG_16_44_10]|uniref:Uncharacterized protein n=1 Tax=Candidatus Woykebacteria bacterium RBG_16_44_10 TaxID=1802597 RepID=A0A1G1WEB5_9BACT|nr:MAG: hypothetical protein A2Z24_02585 [Candidatus Woykebacteria bacterium RBG_16_44_10]
MKKLFLRYIGIGLLMIVVFNVALFLISLLFGFEGGAEGPTLIPAVFFAVVMGLIVYWVVKRLKPISLKEAFAYSISWASIVLIAILATTIANDTTSIFFGRWFNYLVFLAMGISPALLNFSKGSEKPS